MHSITTTGQVKQDIQKEQLISVTASVFLRILQFSQRLTTKFNYEV